MVERASIQTVSTKHNRAQAVEERWRTAHGFDTKLRGKHQVEAKRKRRPLERGEVRRREERERQRVERQMLTRPLLKGVGGRCRNWTKGVSISDGPMVRLHRECGTDEGHGPEVELGKPADDTLNRRSALH